MLYYKYSMHVLVMQERCRVARASPATGGVLHGLLARPNPGLLTFCGSERCTPKPRAVATCELECGVLTNAMLRLWASVLQQGPAA